MADIFDEVNDDLRRERMQASWRRWSPSIAAGALLVVLGTAGLVWWRQHEVAVWQDYGQTFSRLDHDAGTAPTRDTLKQLEVLGSLADDGYPVLARFRSALARAGGDDLVGGIAALNAIAADPSVAPAYRDLAFIDAAGFGLDTGSAADILARLKPYTVPANPWRFSALEYSALAELRLGRHDEAMALYRQLADDPDAPQAVRARATEILAAVDHQG